MDNKTFRTRNHGWNSVFSFRPQGRVPPRSGPFAQAAHTDGLRLWPSLPLLCLRTAVITDMAEIAVDFRESQN